MCQCLQGGRSCENELVWWEEEGIVLNVTISLFHRVKYYVSIHTKNVYGGIEVQFHALTSVPGDGDWLISSPGRSTPPGKSSGYLMSKKLGEPQVLSGRFGEDINTGCPRRNVPDFGRVFLMLKYTDITQNTYVQI